MVSGLFGNPNYDEEGSASKRQEVLDSVMQSTEERFEEQVLKIYGYDTSEDIEQYMLENDPLFTAIETPYQQKS